MSVLVGKFVYNQDLLRARMFCLVGNNVLSDAKVSTNPLISFPQHRPVATLFARCLLTMLISAGSEVLQECARTDFSRWNFRPGRPLTGTITSEMENDNHDFLIMSLPTSRQTRTTLPPRHNAHGASAGLLSVSRVPSMPPCLLATGLLSWLMSRAYRFVIRSVSRCNLRRRSHVSGSTPCFSFLATVPNSPSHRSPRKTPPEAKPHRRSHQCIASVRVSRC